MEEEYGCPNAIPVFVYPLAFELSGNLNIKN